MLNHDTFDVFFFDVITNNLIKSYIFVMQAKWICANVIFRFIFVFGSGGKRLRRFRAKCQAIYRKAAIYMFVFASFANRSKAAFFSHHSFLCYLTPFSPAPLQEHTIFRHRFFCLMFIVYCLKPQGQTY